MSFIFQGEEEGEAVEEEEKIRYDLEKLVDFPGFNMPVPEGFRDDGGGRGGRGRWPPPLRADQSKEAMVKELGDRVVTGYVRGEMQDTGNEDDVGAIKDRKRKMPEDGEEKEEEEGEEDDGPPGAKKLALSGALKSDEVKLVNEGTPIVDTYSPYEALPSQQAWAVGTTDHILFENLPDSTGKWDQMRGVLQKGREMRKSLQKKKTQEETTEENGSTQVATEGDSNA